MSTMKDIEIDAEIEQARKENQDVEDIINDCFEVIKNMAHIRTNIKKFGLTKELLHLVNGNNNFGAAIGLSLPYYESENIDQVDEKELKDTDVVMESIDSFISDMKAKLIALYTKVKEGWLKFYTFIKSKLDIRSLLLKKKVTDYKETKVEEHKAEGARQLEKKRAEIFLGLQVAFYKKEYLFQVYANAKACIEATQKITYDKDNKVIKNLDALKEISKFTNVQYYEDEDGLIAKKGSVDAFEDTTEGTMASLGWTEPEALKFCTEISEHFNDSEKRRISDKALYFLNLATTFLGIIKNSKDELTEERVKQLNSLSVNMMRLKGIMNDITFNTVKLTQICINLIAFLSTANAKADTDTE